MKLFNQRQTKIVATLGPSSQNFETIKKLIQAGVNIFRLNFSHGTSEVHQNSAALIRQASQELKIEVGILADLQGPKIRISRFKNKQVELKENTLFILDAHLDKDAGDEFQVGIDYKDLPKDVSKGDTLLLDDGRIVFEVNKVNQDKIFCKVITGGILSNNKGINKLGGGLSAEALTDKDKIDMKIAIAMNADYIAISFPRSAEDMNYARSLLKKDGGYAHLIAKIERAEAIDELDKIILASDAVMVARGDLGVEIGDTELPSAQKLIINRARALNKAVITATQMMETMIENNIPTRAEVFDVANAVLDYTDAVMLSGETASGKHPVKVVETMSRICISAEKNPQTKISKHRLDSFFENIDEAIAMASMYTANHTDINAIVSLTETGKTPLLMSRIKTGTPIYAFSPNIISLRQSCLYRGVFPLYFSFKEADPDNIFNLIKESLLNSGAVKKGDKILITCGDFGFVQGSTNSMKIIVV